jgi:predicted signal transduction protein with EAL and GGDEF domain
MEAPVSVGDLAIHLGTSIGIALCPTNALDAEELHTKADLALYRAKSEGRGIFRFFDGAMDEQLLQRRRLEADLRTAVDEDQLHLHYQPFSCVETGAVTGFEALVRWSHAELGAISPSEFIPLAEENGLIPQIGDFVLAKACAEAARWPNALRIAVNVSPAQLVQGDLVATVRDILARTGLAADRLDLEVTEGVLLQSSAKAIETLRALQALGISIALDDFGTGYSALGYFRTFPFDKVKIDRSFVAGLPQSREARAIVKAIIGLGRGLDMSIIAEGVETRDQLALLQAEGCHKVQGYLVGRPGPIEKFEHLLDGQGHVSHPCPTRCDTCGQKESRKLRRARLHTV